MKIKDLKELGKEVLQEKFKELKLELMKEQSQVAVGTAPKNVGKMRTIKKTIARINSLLVMEVKEKI
ncbi:50S ribosomal protein L29 [Candidatus Woesearchaeota archaeon]|nr:50S ribosomal protein L29 [Candidatus Woesearchaeota archaeon]